MKVKNSAIQAASFNVDPLSLFVKAVLSLEPGNFRPPLLPFAHLIFPEQVLIFVAP